MKMTNEKTCLAYSTCLFEGSSLITAKWKLHWQTFKYIQVTYTYKVNKRKWICLSSEGISRKHSVFSLKKKITWKISNFFNKNTNFHIISRFMIVQDLKIIMRFSIWKSRQYVKLIDKQQNVFKWQSNDSHYSRLHSIIYLYKSIHKYM